MRNEKIKYQLFSEAVPSCKHYKNKSEIRFTEIRVQILLNTTIRPTQVVSISSFSENYIHVGTALDENHDNGSSSELQMRVQLTNTDYIRNYHLFVYCDGTPLWSAVIRNVYFGVYEVLGPEDPVIGETPLYSVESFSRDYSFAQTSAFSRGGRIWSDSV